MIFDRNKDKDELLFKERGICFQDVVNAVELGLILGDVPHHNIAAYPNQYTLIVIINGYPHVVPYVLTESGVHFLKTIYPSRKHK